MDDKMQNDGLVKSDLRNFERLKEERSPYDGTFRDIDEMFPNGAGGFQQMTPGQVRTDGLFDTTHITALNKFKAAMTAITVPEEKQYIKPRFADPELMKSRDVQLWCERAGQRLYDIRYAALTGFGVSADEDFDQLGRYGTSAVWQEAIPGRGLIYRTLHLSSCYIDTDHAGLVDTVFRDMEKTARECEQIFGMEALTPKMRDCLAKPGKEHTKFQLIHIVTPNTAWDQDMLDWRRLPISSRYLAVDEKIYLRRGGFHTMPITVSRHMTSPMEKYGRSPAVNMLPTILGLNQMRRGVLRAGHKAIDPALVYFDDDGITGLSTKPGGLTSGLVSEDGRVLVARMPGGENGIPYAQEMIAEEQQVVREEFLEAFYKILYDPNSRMTTTEVLEVMAKQGILVRPYANRYRTEKQSLMCARDLDLALREGQIEPFPPEVEEAGAWPIIDYDNPLAAMARAEQTGKTMRFVEVAGAINTLAEGAAGKIVDIEAMLRGSAEEIGVRPSYILSPEQIEENQQADAEAQAAVQGVDALEGIAGAYSDIAKGNQLVGAA
jgi:hypothetical protein